MCLPSVQECRDRDARRCFSTLTVTSVSGVKNLRRARERLHPCRKGQERPPGSALVARRHGLLCGLDDALAGFVAELAAESSLKAPSRKWAKNKGYRKAQEIFAPEFALVRAVIHARMTAGLRQEHRAQ